MSESLWSRSQQSINKLKASGGNLTWMDAGGQAIAKGTRLMYSVFENGEVYVPGKKRELKKWGSQLEGMQLVEQLVKKLPIEVVAETPKIENAGPSFGKEVANILLNIPNEQREWVIEEVAPEVFGMWCTYYDQKTVKARIEFYMKNPDKKFWDPRLSFPDGFTNSLLNKVPDKVVAPVPEVEEVEIDM